MHTDNILFHSQQHQSHGCSSLKAAYSSFTAQIDQVQRCAGVVQQPTTYSRTRRMRASDALAGVLRMKPDRCSCDA